MQLIENKEQFSKVPANVRSSVITSLNLLEQKLDKHALLKEFKKDKHPENRIVEINEHINKVSQILENNNNNYVNETLSLLKTRLEEYKKDIENTLQRAESESLINNLSDESTKKHLTYISKLIDNKGYKQIIIDKAEKGELRRREIAKHIKSKIDALTEFSETCTTDQPEEVWEAVTSLKNRLELLEKDIFKELKVLDEERISKEFSDERGNLSESDKEKFTIELLDDIEEIKKSLNPSAISRKVANTAREMQISEEDAKHYVLTNLIYQDFHEIEEVYYRHNVFFKSNEQELIKESFSIIEHSIDKLNQEIKANKNYLINEPIYENREELQEKNMLSATADYNFLRRNNNVQLYNDTISQSAIIQHNIKPELPKRDPEVTQATNKQLGYQEIKYNDSSIQAGDNGLDYGSDDYATVKKPKNRGNLSQNNEHVDPIYDTLSSIAGTTADIGNSSKDDIYAVPSSVVRKSENRGNSSKDPIYDEPKSAIKKPADIGNSSEDPIYDEPKSTIKKPVDIGNSSQNPHSATDPTTTSQEIKILSNMFDRLNIMLSIKNEQEKNNVDSSNLDPTTTSKEIQHKKKTPPPVPPNKPTGAKKKTPPPVPPNKPTGAKVNTPLIPKPYKGILTETANLQDALACLDANRSNKDNKVYPNGDNKVNRDDNKVKRDNNKGDNMSLEQHDLNPNKKKRKEEETKRQEKNNKEKSNLVML